MNIIQLSQHVFKCEFKIDVPIHIPVSCSFYLRGISPKIFAGKNSVDEYLWSWKEKRDIFAIILFKLLQQIKGNI